MQPRQSAEKLRCTMVSGSALPGAPEKALFARGGKADFALRPVVVPAAHAARRLRLKIEAPVSLAFSFCAVKCGGLCAAARRGVARLTVQFSEVREFLFSFFFG